MIRITQGNETAGRVVLRVEGHVAGQAVDELERVLMAKLAESQSVDLDLSGVAFLDGTGARMVNHLIGLGVRIPRCSSFVAEILGPGADVGDPESGPGTR